MKKFGTGGRSYEVDDRNFLLDYSQWDEDFARGTADELNMGELSEAHWRVIRFIRETFVSTGICPVISETCRALGMNARAMQELFPAGYMRGACLLAGISYKYGWVYFGEEPYEIAVSGKKKLSKNFLDKIYRVDLFGSLVDPSEWDEDFAIRRAYEMNIRGGLSGKHWEVIRYLRGYYEEYNSIPTIYACCEENGIDIEEFARLFPSGYHRGAVRIAGLPTFR